MRFPSAFQLADLTGEFRLPFGDRLKLYLNFRH